MTTTERTLTLVAAIGAGLVGGVLFAFSTFVMRALRQLPPAQGLSAMQSINKAAPTPLFMLALLGTAVISLILVVLALNRLTGPSARYVVAGSVLYLAGVVLTMAYHVPRNNALALIAPTAPGAAGTWHHYVTAWTAWNHVRTLTSAAAAIAFTLAFGAGQPRQPAALHRPGAPAVASWPPETLGAVSRLPGR
jgi:uncharacterized membrane protein